MFIELFEVAIPAQAVQRTVGDMDVAHPLILERKRSERYCMPRSPMPPMKPIGPGPAVSSQMGCRVRALSSFSDLVEGPPRPPAATALMRASSPFALPMTMLTIGPGSRNSTDSMRLRVCRSHDSSTESDGRKNTRLFPPTPKTHSVACVSTLPTKSRLSGS